MAASAEMAAPAQRVATASEMPSAGSMPAAATASAARGVLRPSQSRRSRYRDAHNQGAGGSHYISHARVGHNSSPLFQPPGHF